MKLKTFYATAATLLFVVSANAQTSPEGFVIPRTNSKAEIHQTIASTQIEINYNRPNKRGWQIFGDLVPYDQIWRTGSDEATKLHSILPKK